MTIDAAIMRPRVAPVGDWARREDNPSSAVSEGRIRGRSPAQMCGRRKHSIRQLRPLDEPLRRHATLGMSTPHSASFRRESTILTAADPHTQSTRYSRSRAGPSCSPTPTAEGRVKNRQTRE